MTAYPTIYLLLCLSSVHLSAFVSVCPFVCRCIYPSEAGPHVAQDYLGLLILTPPLSAEMTGSHDSFGHTVLWLKEHQAGALHPEIHPSTDTRYSKYDSGAPDTLASADSVCFLIIF